jgi:deoxyribodipyrimidine photolyase-related protein
MKLALILGDCLFSDHKTLEPDKDTIFFMSEDVGLCTHFKYHKHKIIFFLSAMREHALQIKKKYKLHYEHLDNTSYDSKLLKAVKRYKIKEIVTYDISDKFFEKKIKGICKKNKIGLKIVPSPKFLTTKEEFKKYLGNRKPRMQHFYQWQRKRLKILMEGDKPKGGKWSFDQENRRHLPKNIKIPSVKKTTPSTITKKVIIMVDKKFKDHPGDSKDFYLPTTRKGALSMMDQFFKQRYKEFGPYEDAISKNHDFIFHSLLTPFLNCGLLTPKEVLTKSLNTKAPIESKEGFIRQIIGWREFIKGMYDTQKLDQNFFKHKRKMTKAWYLGELGIPPVDDAIKKANRLAYCHHIERLMILSNFMLLCQINPKQVYAWFMELFIDSADWVMEPNVYGMGQYADGGTFTTKPYISGSSYILKMSDYKKGGWCDIWDGLYWRFIEKHSSFFKKNPRLAIMPAMLSKMKKERKAKIFKAADEFLKRNTR